MKLSKMLLALFVLGFVFVALPAAVVAEDNVTTNTTTNTTTNVTTNTSDVNVTANTTTNVTTNTTLNVTTNTTTNTSINTSINTTNTTTTNTTNTSDDDDEDVDDDESEVDDEVQVRDVALGNTNHGMEVRLLQLQKSLTRNVEYGQLIVDEIDNQNFSVNTNNLEDILDDATALNLRIKVLLDKTPVNVSTETFVALKAEAINLSFEFKKEVYNTLTAEQLEKIKKALKDQFEKKDKNSEKRKEIEKKIKEKAREHNMEQALKIYEKFELNNSELRERIEAGNFSSKELKDELKHDFDEMRKEQKQKTEEKIKEEREKYKEAKVKISGDNMKLNKTQVESIVNDDSLTWEEKEAKIRILAQEKKQENKDALEYNAKLREEARNNVRDQVKDNREEIKSNREENRGKMEEVNE